MKDYTKLRRVFSLSTSNMLAILVIYLILLLSSVFNKLSAQVDPCMSLTTTKQASSGTETRLERVQLSTLDSTLYKYWNESKEDKLVKIKKIETDLNNKKQEDVINYIVDPCDPGGGGGCSIDAPAPSDFSRCGPGRLL